MKRSEFKAAIEAGIANDPSLTATERLALRAVGRTATRVASNYEVNGVCCPLTQAGVVSLARPADVASIRALLDQDWHHAFYRGYDPIANAADPHRIKTVEDDTNPFYERFDRTPVNTIQRAALVNALQAVLARYSGPLTVKQEAALYREAATTRGFNTGGGSGDQRCLVQSAHHYDGWGECFMVGVRLDDEVWARLDHPVVEGSDVAVR